MKSGRFNSEREKKEFEEGLAEGYRENAELDRQLCEEFKYVDAEALGPDE